MLLLNQKVNKCIIILAENVLVGIFNFMEEKGNGKFYF